MIVSNSARPVIDLGCDTIEVGRDHPVVVADGNVRPGVQRHHYPRIVPSPPRVDIGKGPLDVAIRVKRHLILTFFVDDDLSRVR